MVCDQEQVMMACICYIFYPRVQINDFFDFSVVAFSVMQLVSHVVVQLLVSVVPSFGKATNLS